MFSSDMELADACILVVDCQATGANPDVCALLELGWACVRARDGAGAVAVRQALVRLPEGARVPPQVARLTGLGAAELARGIEPSEAWAALAADIARMAPADAREPVPAVIHFARFEERFLRALAARHAPDEPFRLAPLCTHTLAKRLVPALPRYGLRALTGYFGRAVGPLRRSAEHVVATAFVWHHLVAALALEHGVRTFAELARWLAAPRAPSAPAPRARARRRYRFPLPREKRLGLPDLPGVYRLLRQSGDVLYVGKASSLRERVNDHFRGRGAEERALEMLTQVRDLAFTLAPSALEAALLESDTIKDCAPPYNVALQSGARPWFARTALATPERSADGAVFGPLVAREPVARLGALLRALEARTDAGPESVSGVVPASAAAILGVPPRFAPEPARFAEGLALFAARHHAHLTNARTRAPWRLIGTELFRRALAERAATRARQLRAEPGPEAEPPDAARDAPGEGTSARLADPAAIADELDDVVLRAAYAVRRGAWLCRLSEATLAWRESAHAERRMLALSAGEVVEARALAPGEELSVPVDFRKRAAERRAAFDLRRFDRMSVLTAELKRLVASGAAVTLRVGSGRALDTAALARILPWV